jgi:SnoaL-like domain
MSKEVADSFVEALRKLEENEDVEALVELHTGDCEVGNVSVPGIFRGHEGLREFWRRYRSTFGEMRSEFRNVFATEVCGAGVDDGGYFERGLCRLRRCEHPGDRGRQGPSLHGLLRHPRPRSPSRGLMASREPLVLTDPRIEVLRNPCLLLDICPLA